MDEKLARAVLVASAVTMAGCSGATRMGARETAFAQQGQASGRRITQAELADDIMRFEGRFADRVAHASAPLEASDSADLRQRALENELRYDTSALDIAVGPLPEADLLDMVTFVELSRDLLERHWIPDVFGAQGAPMDKAFRESSTDIWAIARKVLTPAQCSELVAVIREWRAAHPDQVYVESVRLSDFAEIAGQEATRIDQEASGLLAGAQKAVQAVDASRMLGERALFALQRMPALLRMQTRLTASDVLGDATERLAQVPNPAEGASGRRMERLLVELQQLLVDSQKALELANATFESPNLRPAVADIRAMAAQLTELLRELNRTLESPAQARAVEQTSAVADRLEKTTNRLLWRAFLAACGVVLFAAIVLLLSRMLQRRLGMHAPIPTPTAGS